MPRKQHTHHFIYRTTCTVTGNFYIGMHSTSNLEDGYLGSGKRLWNSIRKYGKESHVIEILEWFSDRITLKNREKEIVNEDLLRYKECMNLKIGGEGGFCNDEHKSKAQRAGGTATLVKLNKRHFEKLESDPEYRERILKNISSRNKGEGNPFFGKTHSQEFKSRMSSLMTERQKGENNSQFGTVWMKHDSLGVRKVRKEDVTLFQENGWKRGRK